MSALCFTLRPDENRISFYLSYSRVAFLDMKNKGDHWLSVEAFATARGVEAARLPRSVKVLLEAALGGVESGRTNPSDCDQILNWQRGTAGQAEWRFPIGRVLLQDASGLPLLADLAALRDAVGSKGSDPGAIELKIPATLVFDHSVETDHWGTADALRRNMAEEFSRNRERHEFARWAEQAFTGLKLIPPGNGIVHQVHLEKIAEVVSRRGGTVKCDTVVGTDSHTTMVNGLGVLGWGVGGIEAQAALLGRALSIASPEIIGVELLGRPSGDIAATDLALALTARLRREGVVGAFLEFYGPGVRTLGVADRCTIANMAPEYGATQALFPVDEAVISYLSNHGRSARHLQMVRSHLGRQGLFGDQGALCLYDRTIRFDLSQVAATVAGPSRPDQELSLGAAAHSLRQSFPTARLDGRVVLAAITSCTNTANLESMAAAGILARKAVAAGLVPPRWVKTVFAPGSRATAAALRQMGLLVPLAKLGFHIAAYGCGPCVGNTGSLAPDVESELSDGAVAAAVLSGNRNFEGRIHPSIRAAYLMSPALVLAYALAGRMDLDLTSTWIGGRALLAELWPSSAEIESALGKVRYARAREDESQTRWSSIAAPAGPQFLWAAGSTHFVKPPFLATQAGNRLSSIIRAPPLLLLGDAVTTDHISPVGAIPRDSAAGRHLAAAGVAIGDLGTYASRRVNHEVMLRGTFANPRLVNRLVAAGGPITRHMASGRVASVHEVARGYREEGRDTVVLAGWNYGTGSARDWAAKGTALLGVRAVLARSFERIHRGNLVALGVLPIEVQSPENPWSAIGPATQVSVSISLSPDAAPNSPVGVQLAVDGRIEALDARLRISTLSERDQLRVGTLFHRCLEDAIGRQCS
jgi:aconitate hydratase